VLFVRRTLGRVFLGRRFEWSFHLFSAEPFVRQPRTSFPRPRPRRSEMCGCGGCCCRADGSCAARLPRAAARASFAAAMVALPLICTFVPLMSQLLSFALALAITIGAVWAFCAPPPPVAAASPPPPELLQPPAADAASAAAATGADHQHDETAESSSLVAEAPRPSGPAAPPSGASSPRLVYIDNLKSALTAVVVVHHVLGAFAGGGSVGLSVGNFRNALQPFLMWLQIVNQSWFMCAFFFLAGLVAPGSLRRKGARGFLADRLRRLGAPFAIYFWVVNPLLTLYVDVVVAGRASSYNPGAGPPWFVAWLLIFSVCLTLVSDGGRDDPGFVETKRPSLVTLCGFGALLGALNFVEMVYVPGLVFMPITFGSFPLDCAFFATGVIAARNGWLDEGLLDDANNSATTGAAGGRKEGEDAAAGVIAFALAAAGCIAACFFGLAGALVSENGCGEWPSRGSPGLVTLIVVLVLSVCGGAFAVAALVASLDLFRRTLNAHTPLSAFLAQHAYACYLVHPCAVIPLTGAFIAVARLRTGNANSFNYPASGAVDFSDCVGDGAAGVLFLGVLVVSGLALPLTLALAFVAKKLPVLCGIL